MLPPLPGRGCLPPTQRGAAQITQPEPSSATTSPASAMEAYNQYKALDAQGRYAEAEPFAAEALEHSPI